MSCCHIWQQNSGIVDVIIKTYSVEAWRNECADDDVFFFDKAPFNHGNKDHMLALTGVTKRPKNRVENFLVNPARSILKEEKATGYWRKEIMLF